MTIFHTDLATIGLTVELAGVGAYLYSMQLQYKTHEAWLLSAKAAKAQLGQRAIESVLKLQARVQEALNQLIEGEQLGEGRIDPALFADDVADFQRFQSQKANVDVLYSRMKRVSPWIARSLLLLLLAVPALTTRLAWERPHWPVVFLVITLSTCIAGFCSALLLGSIFLHARGQLARAVMTGGGDDI